MEIAIKRALNECFELTSVDTLDNDYIQQTIGGYFEIISLPFNLVVLCDEEGKLKDKEVTWIFSTDREYQLVGTLILCGIDEQGEFTSLNRVQKEFIEQLSTLV